MKIAIIGAGRVGGALGTALRPKGHDIVYGVRAPERSQEHNAKSVAGAISGSDVVIMATPWSAAESLVCEHAWSLAGKILIDATNPLSPNASGLAVGFDTSGAEMLQSQAPEARVFKAFNSVGADVLANPRFADTSAAMFVAGPEGAEKNKVMALVTEVGFDAVDAGPLKSARLLEPLAMLCLQTAQARKDPSFALLLGKRAGGQRGALHFEAARDPVESLPCP